MGIDTATITQEFAWLNVVPQGAHLWRIFGSELVDITNSATLVNLHCSNAAKALDERLAR